MVAIAAVEIEPLSPEELAIVAIARQHFWFFLENVYVHSFAEMTYMNDDGQQVAYGFNDPLHREWAMVEQYNPRLCLMAPRNHLKTTVMAQGFAFWQMFRVKPGRVEDILYLSYKAQLAAEKIEDLLRMIRSNPFCRHWKDQKPQAMTQIHFHVNFGEGTIGEAQMISGGIFGSTRGRHPTTTICDDILSDFANPLSSQELNRITRIFRRSIMSLPPNPDNPLIVVGTPQAYEDVLHLIAGLDDWMWLSYPAIVDEKNEVVQWPEKYSYGRLKRIQRDVGRTAFEVEYQLTPVQVLDQFFTREDILNVIDAKLMAWPLDEVFKKTDLATYGGFDVGRKIHPSHISVLLELPSGTLVQLFSEFLDQMRYPAQIKMLNDVAVTFNLSRGYFDATFNALEDRGLKSVWRGRAFNKKLKADMATLFEKRVVAPPDDCGIILLNDLRQMRQIVSVDKELKAATTVDGHGDAFWSNGLAIKAAEDGPSIINISSPTPTVRAPGLEGRSGQTWLQQLGVR